MSATTARAGSQEDAALGAYSTECLGDRLRRDGRGGHSGRDERRQVHWGWRVGIGKVSRNQQPIGLHMHVFTLNCPISLRLQASLPSNHVWSNFESPGSPHWLNQAPPGAQQLSLPDLLKMPHLGHTSLIAVVVGGVEDTGLTSRYWINIHRDCTRNQHPFFRHSTCMHLHSVIHKLTFASRFPLGPGVIKL